MPRVIIISSHGSMPLIDDVSFALPKAPDVGKKPVKPPRGKKVADTSASAAVSPPAFDAGLGVSTMKLKKPDFFKAPVDIFTAAKCGKPFCADLRCDAPYVGLVYMLSQHHHHHHMQSHDAKDVRRVIEEAMLQIKSDPRHQASLSRAENEISCHKKGSRMTDLFLFCPSLALPIVESVTMVDMDTGVISDAHAMFGLTEKPAESISSLIAAVQPDEFDMAGLQHAKQHAAWGLQTLKGADPFYIEMKNAHIKTIDDTIAGALKASKFEYVPEFKAKYGDRVKLSDLLTIGKLNPKTDTVVVYACRVPDELVLHPLHSPRGSDGEGSEGSEGGRTSGRRSGRRSSQKQKQKYNQRHRRKTCKRRRD